MAPKYDVVDTLRRPWILEQVLLESTSSLGSSWCWLLLSFNTLLLFILIVCQMFNSWLSLDGPDSDMPAVLHPATSMVFKARHRCAIFYARKICLQMNEAEISPHVPLARFIPHNIEFICPYNPTGYWQMGMCQERMFLHRKGGSITWLWHGIIDPD